MRKPAVLLAVLALASACTSDPEPWTPVPHPPAPRAPDRDEQAVLNTLVTLDPCALLGTPKARLSRRPHHCTATMDDGSAVQAAVNERTGHAGRFNLGSEEVGGAKVDAIMRSEPDLCSAEIPVSFDYAITVDLLGGGKDIRCDDLDQWVATVVTNLGRLDDVRHPADRPDLNKDACTVLAAAAADFDSKATLTNEKRTRLSIDECSADLTGIGPTSLSTVIKPVDGAKKWQNLDGKDVYADAKSCRWQWSEGKYAGDEDRVVDLDLDGCKPGSPPDNRVRQLVWSLIKEFGKPTVPGTIDRLTYRPDEPDEPNPGACADYPSDHCEPYQPTPIPGDAQQLTIAAETDPHVLCAATLEAVNAQFPGLRPVVNADVRPTCSYVQPSHAVELDIRALDASTMLNHSTTRKLTIAGHPAEYSEQTGDRQEPRAAVCVDTGKQNAKRGGESFWCGYASFQAAKLDPAAAAKLEPLMAAVATKHLG